jgi:hypothetical protein
VSADIDALLAAVVASLVLVPGSMAVLLPVRAGDPAAWVSAVGVLALLPGLAMGAGGLWTAARG